MATRSGWTFNGHHYTMCESTRITSPIVTYHRDGKRLTEREWRRLMADDRAAVAAGASGVTIGAVARGGDSR